MLVTMQSICEQVTQSPELGTDRNSFLRRVIAFESSTAKWLEADRSDLLSTIDLRIALFLPTEYDA